MDQTQEFERSRDHLRSVAYRMLGSLTEADDALQEAWLRFNRADSAEVENLRAWLTVIVIRVDQGQLGPFAELHGASDVAGLVLAQGTPRARFGRPAIVNGAPGVVVALRDRVLAVAAFTVADGRITSLNIVADPQKLRHVQV